MPIWSELFQLILARLFTIRPKTSDDLLTPDKVFIFLIFLCALFARAVEYITKMLVTMPVTDMPVFVTYKRTVNFVFNHIASISAKVLYFTDLRDIYIKMCINMKRIIRLSENDLHRVITESVKSVINEDFGDRMAGAVRGFRQGEREMEYNESDSSFVDHIYKLATEGIENGNAEEALRNIVNLIGNTRSGQKFAGRSV